MSHQEYGGRVRFFAMKFICGSTSNVIFLPITVHRSTVCSRQGFTGLLEVPSTVLMKFCVHCTNVNHVEPIAIIVFIKSSCIFLLSRYVVLQSWSWSCCNDLCCGYDSVLWFLKYFIAAIKSHCIYVRHYQILHFTYSLSCLVMYLIFFFGLTLVIALIGLVFVSRG